MSFKARDQFGLTVVCDPGDTVGLTVQGTVIETAPDYMRVEQAGAMKNVTKVYNTDDRAVSIIRKFVRPAYKNKDVVLNSLTGDVWQFKADRYCKDRCCTYWMRTGSAVPVGDEEFRETCRQDKLVLVSRGGKPVSLYGGGRGTNGSYAGANTMSKADIFANASF